MKKILYIVIVMFIGMSSTFASKELINVKSINDQLPTRCSAELGILSSCWNQYKSPLKIFKIDSNNINSLFLFFKNKNYQVTKKDDFLIFDFKKEHQNYLNHKKELFSVELLVI